MIDKNDKRYKYLQRKEDKPKAVAPEYEQPTEEREANMRRLMRYRSMWDALSAYRLRRKRIKRYERGLQWEDKIMVNGKPVTEAEYIKEQGKVPLKNNVILQFSSERLLKLQITQVPQHMAIMANVTIKNCLLTLLISRFPRFSS